MVNTASKKEDKNKGLTLIFYYNMKNIIKENIVYIVIILLVILIKIFIVTPVRVRGESMEETLQNNDIMILNKMAYKFNDIKRFDIVVIDITDEYIIKRVIGLPGEKVEYKNNKLYINGKEKKETFNKVDAKELEDFNTEKLGSITVPKDSYLVLGDNRPNSLDSRKLGFIKAKNIVGRTKFTIFPFSKFGNKK